MSTSKKSVLDVLALFFLLAGESFAQDLSRWALGRPSLLIDMPGDPSGGGVAWAERPMYSIFPSAWSAEGSGVRIEVARIYTSKSPSDLMAEVGQKMGVSMVPRGKGQISGREFVNFMNASRMAAVIGHDGGVLGGASWVVVATFKDQAGQALAGAILDSIKVEREGARHWALRSLGPTFLAAELPFELTAVTKSSDREGMQRYESSFDGMDIRVTSETPSGGSVFEKEATLKDFIEGDRNRPGVTNFTFTRSKYKLDDREGDLITKDFKRGTRSYRIYEIAFIEKRSALIASLQIDPNRADHQQTTERFLRTLKTTINSVFGWKTYAIGKDGLYVDLPVAPGPPRQQNAVTIYESNTPLAMTEIRELTVGYPSAHSPDFAAKQYFEMQQALGGNTKYELQGIDKLLIDGLEARLVRATWKNGENVNQRRILTIYGYQTQWIIDMLASKETAAYMERVMQSVRVRLDPGSYRRQSFGTLGVSFLVSQQHNSRITQDPNDPDFAREESVYNPDGKAIFAVHEMVFKKTSVPIADDRGIMFLNSFLRGMGEGAGFTVSGKLRDSFPVNIDGIEGRHLIFDITASNAKPNSVIQADMVMLGQDKTLWTAIVITNYEGGLAARYDRARILNSMRVGM
jgi:hypothetical protein